MNYRHIYHAGNFADVMKHIVLMLCLDYLKQKDKGFCVIDAHGGCGLYDLSSVQAQKTGEYKEGIEKLIGATNPTSLLGPYLAMVKKDMAKGKYPGSPLIIARQLRDQDRLIAGELHTEDYKTLKMVMGSHRNVTIEKRDAYESLRTHLPPAERRGLVLIDPPFEQRDEFERLGRQMKQWAKRFPTGTYLIWYPMKAGQPYAELRSAASEDFPDWLCFETLLHPEDQPESFNGSGLLVLNPPYDLRQKLEILAPVLHKNINLHECRIMTPPAATAA